MAQGCFRNRLFTPTRTFWLFLSQVFSAGGSCQEAVDRALAWLAVERGEVASTNTAAYCQARKRLDAQFVQEVGQQLRERLGSLPAPYGLWQGRAVKVLDGSSVSLTDTPDNQAAYPQPSGQRAGCGFPVMRLACMFALSSGALVGCESGPLKVAERTLARRLWEHLDPRGFCTREFFMLRQRGVLPAPSQRPGSAHRGGREGSRRSAERAGSARVLARPRAGANAPPSHLSASRSAAMRRIRLARWRSTGMRCAPAPRVSPAAPRPRRPRRTHTISTGEIWVSAWVDESAMSAVSTGQKARIVFRSDPHTAYSGSVVRLSREVDRETREFLVDVAADQLPAGWAIGQRAEVFIATARKDGAVLLPTRLVRWRDGAAGAFVDNAGRAAWHSLKLGMTGTNQVEVENGLAAGDVVIAVADSDLQKLQPGRRVTRAR